MTLDELLALYEYFGYTGVFLISFVIGILFFLPIPYFPVPLIASFNENLNPHLISFSGCVGAVLSKMIIFYLSYSGRNFIANKSKGKISSLQVLLSKYGWIGAFVAAATPISGSLIYITLGLSKYKPWKFATAIFAGELLYNEVIVWIGIFIGRPAIERTISQAIEAASLQSVILWLIFSFASIVIALYLMIKVDWNKTIGKWFPWTAGTALKDNESKNKKSGQTE
ncbi:MAG TPA: VTT domain-containing protein [Nitrososphaeraceae archaeon]|nr:VTT domain-containing protein [Nitrososphaeraceae archaeon]